MVKHLCFLLPLSLFPAHALSARNYPHILIVLADDRGHGDLMSHNLDSEIPTPHRDCLATMSIRCIDTIYKA